MAPVLASVPLRPAALTVDGRGTLALATEPAALAKVVALDVRSGVLADMTRDSVLVSDGAARDHGWHVGGTLRLGYPDTGEHAVTIAATYAATDLLDADIITTIAADEAWSTRPQDRQVLVKLRAGVDFAWHVR